MKAGTLLPIEYVQKILEDVIFQNVQQNKKQFVIDGFPRSVDQALLFEENVNYLPPTTLPVKITEQSSGL